MGHTFMAYTCTGNHWTEHGEIRPKQHFILKGVSSSCRGYETVTYGKHSIRYLGPRLWTKLPKSIRDVTTLMSFKSKIRQLNIVNF